MLDASAGGNITVTRKIGKVNATFVFESPYLSNYLTYSQREDIGA